MRPTSHNNLEEGADWARFYNEQVPRFECSDPKFNEIYAFRWFLLKFSTAGGDLGLFRYPVVMEGRQAFHGGTTPRNNGLVVEGRGLVGRGGTWDRR